MQRTTSDTTMAGSEGIRVPSTPAQAIESPAAMTGRRPTLREIRPEASDAEVCAAAKALGLEPKTSDLLARDGSVPGAASGKQLSPAFNLKPGGVGVPLNLGQNWLVYRVAEKQEPNPADFEKQKKELTESVLQSKRELAFQAFRTALEDRLKKEGKLKLMPEKLKGFGTSS